MTTYGLAVVVMATLERSDAAEALAERVEADALVVYDTKSTPRSALRGHRAALLAALEGYVGTTHICVLQEDALPCPDFLPTVQNVIEARPNVLISLYLGNGHGGQAVYMRRLRACQRFAALPLNHFVPTVGIVWPVGHARGFLRFTDGNSVGALDDEAIRSWRQRAHRLEGGIEAVATIPSLVDHDNSLPSVIGHSSHGWRDCICHWESWSGVGGWREGWA